MSLRFCVAGIALVAVSSSMLRAQQAVGSITGVLVSKDAGISLAYGVVAAPSLGLERFTTVTGSFLLKDLPAGQLHLIVRRLGYIPKELVVTVRAGMTDTVRVELSRVAVQLATMHVRAYPDCNEPGAPRPGHDSTLATVFGQVRMNAQQYRLLAESYPFAYAMVSVLGHFDTSGVVWHDRIDTMRIDGLSKWKYKPGKVTSRNFRGRRGELFVNLLTLVDLADPTFIANHCFHNGGLTRVDTATWFRIDFLAAAKIKTSDFDGSIFLDTATYQIRRSVLRLRPLPSINGMTGMEVTTEFAEILPSIPVIAKVSSTQTFETRVRGVRYPTMFDEQRLIEFAFLGPKPGEEKKP
jgi:hypothetical protein